MTDWDKFSPLAKEYFESGEIYDHFREWMIRNGYPKEAVQTQVEFLKDVMTNLLKSNR